jgi:hypothetical protein
MPRELWQILVTISSNYLFFVKCLSCLIANKDGGMFVHAKAGFTSEVQSLFTA